MATLLHLTISGPKFHEHLAIVKSCPYPTRKWIQANKVWEVELNEETVDILAQMPALKSTISAWREEEARKIQAKKIADTEMSKEAVLLKEKYTFLFDYQAIAAAHVLAKKRYLIADEVGTGKTICTMPLIDTMVQAGKRTLILCPSAISRQWASEIKKFIGHDSHSIVKMPKQKRMDAYCNRDNQIIITTYESFRNDAPGLNCRFDCIVADEASKFKNKKSKIYGVLQNIKSDYFLALSGTPIENGLENMFNILSIIHPAFMTRKQFDNTYVNWEFNGFGRVPTGYKNLSKFLMIVSEFMIRRRKCDVAKEMPPVIVQNRIVELTTAQAFYARAIRKYARENDVKGVLLVLNMVGNDVGLLDISQSTTIAEMRLKNLLPTKTEYEPGNKIPAILELMEEIGDKQVLIFTQYKQMAWKVANAMTEAGYKTYVLTGDNKQSERDACIENMRRGDAQVLVATEIFGYGVNLQFINYEINVEIPYNPARLIQRYGRVDRQGSVGITTIINLLSEDIDERIWSIVESKMEVFENVVNGKIIDDEELRAQIMQKLQ